MLASTAKWMATATRGVSVITGLDYWTIALTSIFRLLVGMRYLHHPQLGLLRYTDAELSISS